MSEHQNLARYKKGSEMFEVVINPDIALEVRKGKAEVRDAVVYPKIFSDAKKGMLASEQRLQALFNTTDALAVAKQIIEKGEVQLTQEYRKQLLEQKKKRILDIIRINGVDPRTNAPHPLPRLETALEEAKVRIDEFKQAELQVEGVLQAWRPILPIKFVRKQIELHLSGANAPKCFPVMKAMSKILKEGWNTDGSWTGTVELPGGMEQELYDKLNRICHGDVGSKVIKTE